MFDFGVVASAPAFVTVTLCVSIWGARRRWGDETRRAKGEKWKLDRELQAIRKKRSAGTCSF